MNTIPSPHITLNDLRSAKLGLVLGGGAARGFAHIGFLQELDRAGLRPHCIAGCSIGAFVGAAYAGGDWARFTDHVLKMGRGDLMSMADPVFPRHGLMDGDRVVEFLSSFMRVSRLEDCAPALAVNAADVATGEEVVFTSGPVLPAVRASIALPGMFTPAWNEDRLLVDGGLINPLPVNICRKMNADIVVAVDLNAQVLKADIHLEQTKAAAPGKMPNLFVLLFNSIYIMQRTINLMRLKKEPPDFLIQPELRDYSLMDFFKGPGCAEAGARAARKFISELSPAPGD
ncbi:NTE family protein [Desulfonatronum thiosulfatophilum]|uniref:NTE family protein n=1 Tax=Desulfonatronum thiosulfatophilum TaxID=617002 RepID=A0A1G6ER35_9BACT|nr:patatin-like phospholipase family protein [Desulfonatronum thiosulfatophilum]SDB59732.1 NTE family protein [Desulfonatronum thiosulfatophilum]